MGDFGIRISKDGENVFTADEKDLFLSESYPTFKAYLTGTENFELDSFNLDEIVINHNLGYIPAFLVYYEVASTSRRFLADTWYLDEADGIAAYCSMTNTSLTIYLSGVSEGQSGIIRYYIFRDLLS